MNLSLNMVTLAGNITRDPEGKFLPSGTCVVRMRLAVNRRYKGAAGEWKEEVSYVNVEAWGRTAEHCLEHFKKGACILVVGRLKTHEWEKDGVKRSELEVAADRIQGATTKQAPQAEEAA